MNMKIGKGYSICFAIVLAFIVASQVAHTAYSFSVSPNIMITSRPASLSIRPTSTTTTQRYKNALLAAPLLSTNTIDDTEMNIQLSLNDQEEQTEMEIQRKRDDLKKRLLEAADRFKATQALQQDVKSRLLRQQQSATEVANNADDTKQESGRFIVRLVRRIVSKILRRRHKKKTKKERTVLRSNAFATAKLEVGESGNAVIALAEELAKLNPTLLPTYGWQQQQQESVDGSNASTSKLDGNWKLRFTTAADATFPSSPERGVISTSQEIDATKGTLTNVVDFEKGKIKGFRVVVAGDATSNNELSLTFRRVIILWRNARLFQKLVIPIPAKLLRSVNRFLSRKQKSTDDEARSKGPYLQIQYLDDDLRIHKTGEGNWFIQSRLE